jgi:hypothetical protein
MTKPNPEVSRPFHSYGADTVKTDQVKSPLLTRRSMGFATASQYSVERDDDRSAAPVGSLARQAPERRRGVWRGVTRGGREHQHGSIALHTGCGRHRDGCRGCALDHVWHYDEPTPAPVDGHTGVPEAALRSVTVTHPGAASATVPPPAGPCSPHRTSALTSRERAGPSAGTHPCR